MIMNNLLLQARQMQTGEEIGELYSLETTNVVLRHVAVGSLTFENILFGHTK
jgi:hypothetical protein